jgi:hypothetical protein
MHSVQRTGHLAAAKAFLYPPVKRQADTRQSNSAPAQAPAPSPSAPLHELVGARARARNDGLKFLLRSAEDVIAGQDRLLDEADSVLQPARASSAYRQGQAP